MGVNDDGECRECGHRDDDECPECEAIREVLDRDDPATRGFPLHERVEMELRYFKGRVDLLEQDRKLLNDAHTRSVEALQEMAREKEATAKAAHRAVAAMIQELWNAKAITEDRFE